MSDSKQVGAYFAEWGVYDRAFNAEDAPMRSITHLYFAFSAVCGPLKQPRQAQLNRCKKQSTAAVLVLGCQTTV